MTLRSWIVELTVFSLFSLLFSSLLLFLFIVSFGFFFNDLNLTSKKEFPFLSYVQLEARLEHKSFPSSSGGGKDCADVDR